MSMSEAEFERLLDAVREAIASVPEESPPPHTRSLNELPQAANDNARVRPSIPFAESRNAPS